MSRFKYPNVPDIDPIQLLAREKALIVNGCGPKWLPWLDIPDFGYFEKACERHDILYWQGGDEQHRMRADVIFYWDMRTGLQEAPFWQRVWLRSLAWTYYKAVRIAGGKSFSYRDTRRGLRDLITQARPKK